MLKINYSTNPFSFKIYEDKFMDNSIVRTEVFIDDEDRLAHKMRFEEIMNQIKEVFENNDTSLNTHKLLLKILRAEEIVLTKVTPVHLSPVDIFPRFWLLREHQDGRKEYEGVKYINWETFIHFSKFIINALKTN